MIAESHHLASCSPGNLSKPCSYQEGCVPGLPLPCFETERKLHPPSRRAANLVCDHLGQNLCLSAKFSFDGPGHNLPLLVCSCVSMCVVCVIVETGRRAYGQNRTDAPPRQAHQEVRLDSEQTRRDSCGCRPHLSPSLGPWLVGISRYLKESPK